VRSAPRQCIGREEDLAIYWNEDFAEELDRWGDGNAWTEIRLLLAGREGKVLDVACGTGRSIQDLDRGNRLEVYGCDISDLLIAKAREKGIKPERLTVCNAAALPYPDKDFDYSYSIGSLEHFDLESLESCLKECVRVTRGASFHMVPVSRSGRDEGWTKRAQSFHNNSAQWWMDRFARHYRAVELVESRWDDDISVGKWFICGGEE
jgi:ubiquinone/menaquinone biosynthesis C-methylase UbiE